MTSWVKDLVIISLVIAFTEMLLPMSNIRRFSKVVMGIVLIAIIINSIIDISNIMDDALESQADIIFDYNGTPSFSSWALKGERIVGAGLDIIEFEVTE